jgi:hypothetical protein
LAWTRPVLVFALAFSVLAFPAWAEAQTVTRSNSSDGFADGGFGVVGEITRDVTFPTTDFPSGAAVSNVVVTLDFAKTDDAGGGVNCGPPPTATNTGAANQELYYRLTSPQGTTIDLISAGTYTAVFGLGGEVVVTLSDAAATAVGGAVPTSGTFRPSQALSAFDGQNPEGTWTLTIGDTRREDPNCFYNVDIAVTADSPMPTTKGQCKKGGWRDFEVFKNQGDCVSFVATGGKNPPSGSPSAATKGHRSKPR